MARPSVEEERREQIIEATRRVMVKRGINMMRVSDIAKVAKVSPGIVHYYFETKEDLIRETFEDSFTQSIERRRSILDQNLAVEEKLNALIKSYVPMDDRTKQTWHVWLELWVGALQDEELRKVNDGAYGTWRAMIGEVIEEGQQQGIFRTKGTEPIVNQLVSMIDGLAVQVMLRSTVITAEEMNRLCSLFIEDHLALG